jgi:hypothetical protein
LQQLSVLGLVDHARRQLDRLVPCGWSVGRSVSQSAGLLVGWLAGWLASWLARTREVLECAGEDLLQAEGHGDLATGREVISMQAALFISDDHKAERPAAAAGK